MSQSNLKLFLTKASLVIGGTRNCPKCTSRYAILEHNMDINELDFIAQKYMYYSAALKESTHRTYNSTEAHYTNTSV